MNMRDNYAIIRLLANVNTATIIYMKQVLLLASCVVGGTATYRHHTLLLVLCVIAGTARCCQHRVVLPVPRIVVGTAHCCWPRVLLLASCVTLCCYRHRALLCIGGTRWGVCVRGARRGAVYLARHEKISGGIRGGQSDVRMSNFFSYSIMYIDSSKLTNPKHGLPASHGPTTPNDPG